MTLYVPPLATKDNFIQNVAIGQLAQGRTNATGTATLTSGAVQSTVVTAPFCANGFMILLSPLSVDAAGALATLWTSAVNGQFTIYHSSSSTTDRTFGWIAIG